MPIENPILTRAINEIVRPLAERARGLLIESEVNATSLAALLTELAEVPDSETINDGRYNDGVRSLTVGQLRDCVTMLSDLVTSINADSRLSSVLGACVRKIQVD